MILDDNVHRVVLGRGWRFAGDDQRLSMGVCGGLFQDSRPRQYKTVDASGDFWWSRTIFNNDDNVGVRVSPRQDGLPNDCESQALPYGGAFFCLPFDQTQST